MKIDDFAIERYFSRYEFTANFLMSSSDCDGLSLNYLMSLATKEEMDSWNKIKLGYTETRGSTGLRQAISKKYRNISTDNIIVCSPGEANFSLMNVLLNKGDEVICMSPVYQSLYGVASALGCRIKFWQAGFIDNRWFFDPSVLKKLVSKKTKLIVINFPHNPTGYSPSPELFNEIIRIARENGIILFSDEMYRFLTHEKEMQIPSACDIYENAVSLWGTSKSFGLAGLRMGWLTSLNSDILKRVEAFKDYLSICNSLTSEIPAMIAINNSEKIIGGNLSKIKSNIKLFVEFAERNRHFIDFPLPDSGSTAFVKLKSRIPAMEFAENTVRDTGVLLLPSETFNYGTSHLRIGFGRESFPNGLAKLEDYVNSKKCAKLLDKN